MASINQHESPQKLKGEFQECWWMQAGVVPYKLCDRDYDCDHCPFDEVLQGKTAKLNFVTEWTDGITSNQQTCQPTNQPCKLVRSLFYHPAHVWARIEEGGSVRTGIDDFGQVILGRAYSVDLPAPGSKVRQGDGCWRFTHQGGVTLLAAPVSGTVKKVNPALAQSPTLLNRDPYGEGWAILIEPDDLKRCLKRLLYGHKVTDWQDQQIELLTHTANQFYGFESAPVGATMTDGGWLSEGGVHKTTAGQRRQLIAAIFPQTSTEEAANNNAILLKDGR
jgi:glycine cleavage system H lipoate-binding protein